jgi:hypothetical protein
MGNVVKTIKNVVVKDSVFDDRAEFHKSVLCNTTFNKFFKLSGSVLVKPTFSHKGRVVQSVLIQPNFQERVLVENSVVITEEPQPFIDHNNVVVVGNNTFFNGVLFKDRLHAPITFNVFNEDVTLQPVVSHSVFDNEIEANDEGGVFAFSQLNLRGTLCDGVIYGSEVEVVGDVRFTVFYNNSYVFIKGDLTNVRVQGGEERTTLVLHSSEVVDSAIMYTTLVLHSPVRFYNTRFNDTLFVVKGQGRAEFYNCKFTNSDNVVFEGKHYPIRTFPLFYFSDTNKFFRFSVRRAKYGK